MPLQFIFGPSGSGKSYHLYHQIIDESRLHQEQNYIVLVPEQFTMQTQKDLVNMHPCHGIMNIDVLSFVRLSYRVFEETGGGTLPVLDDEGKNLILRKIAGDYEGELKVLGGNMKKLGSVSYTHLDVYKRQEDGILFIGRWPYPDDNQSGNGAYRGIVFI